MKQNEASKYINEYFIQCSVKTMAVGMMMRCMLSFALLPPPSLPP